jgi:cysteine desulfurase/selenocysteine lyase
MNREDFPILTETVYGKPLVYLDNAATTQKPTAMLDALTDAYLHRNANIHRGVHYLSQIATQQHEAARKKAADFIGANSEKEIIFTKGTTDSLNMLAFCFGEYGIHQDDEIIVSQLEHHSNIVPWQMLCQRKKAHLRVLPLDSNLRINANAVETLITPRTRIISIAHVSNVLGTIQPIENIIRVAHKHNIPVCIDGAQSAPHLPVNVKDLDCDFYVCSAHKMYGPTGLGILYGKEEWLNILPPAEGGGEMIEHVRFEQTTYNTLPYKFEAGTPNFIGSCAFAAALDYINSLGRDTVCQYEQQLTAYMEQQLAAIPEVRVYSPGTDKAGAVSFNVYNGERLIHPFDVGTLLDRQGVAVRTGHHCAEPLIDELGVPGTVRVSFGLYNDRSDVDAFIAALLKAITMLS